MIDPATDGETAKIEAQYHYKKFCEALGIDLTRPDTIDTPRRVANMMYEDFLVGTRPPDFNFTMFPSEGSNQLVAIPGIRVVSICAHHHLPIQGLIHVCYLPNERLVGLSKIPRAVQWIARQPTMQEHIINQIVDYLGKQLEPRFIGVSMVGEHTCMSCRGVNEHGALTVTNKFWVSNKEQLAGKSIADFETTKQEFMHAIQMWHQTKTLSM